MDSEDIALAIAGGGLLLGVARLAVAILSYRLDARRTSKARDAAARNARTAIQGDASEDSQMV